MRDTTQIPCGNGSPNPRGAPDGSLPHPSSTGIADFMASGGEMGKVVRAKDWSKTPLGPIDGWPQSLRTTVSLCLASNFPISMAWGAGRIQIYNDGYWPICAAKHPHSMGQDFKECWFSAWPVIGGLRAGAARGDLVSREPAYVSGPERVSRRNLLHIFV